MQVQFLLGEKIKARDRKTKKCWENKEQSHSASHTGFWKDGPEINEKMPWIVAQSDGPYDAALGDQKSPALSTQDWGRQVSGLCIGVTTLQWDPVALTWVASAILDNSEY